MNPWFYLVLKYLCSNKSFKIAALGEGLKKEMVMQHKNVCLDEKGKETDTYK